jgi:D-serine deaminase-like pyridoxal phosphate-dependent protein
MSLSMNHWYEIANVDDIASPALLVYPDRVERNIRRAIDVIGDTNRLRPHVKTHKMAEVIGLHVTRGVTRFKAATIAEAEMTANAGAADVLLAYQPVGPNVQRVVALMRKFPATRFGVVVDEAQTIDALETAAAAAGLVLDVWLDVDCGMHRTGTAPECAVPLYGRIASAAGLRAAGLHAYDGHIHDSDLDERRRKADEAYASVAITRRNLEAHGHEVPSVVMSGTPTFPIHAARPTVQCSPGTYVFLDFGYGESLEDLPFEVAALVLTRVVSKPSARHLCLDLGHKSIAAENPHPRVKFLNLPEAQATIHSEEHLVVETPHAGAFRVGDALYGVPRHICPTVALHAEAVVVRNARAEERWAIVARDRVLTI